MDKQYDSYCVVDPFFYDSLSNTKASTSDFAADRAVPVGWERAPVDDWLLQAPIGGSLPQQGWKVHISACLDNAERVLGTVWDYCVPRGLSFKFLRGPQSTRSVRRIRHTDAEPPEQPDQRRKRQPDHAAVVLALDRHDEAGVVLEAIAPGAIEWLMVPLCVGLGLVKRRIVIVFRSISAAPHRSPRFQHDQSVRELMGRARHLHQLAQRHTIRCPAGVVGDRRRRR